MPSSGLEDLDRAVQERRRARRRGAAPAAAPREAAPPQGAPASPADGGRVSIRDRPGVTSARPRLPRIDPAKLPVLGIPAALVPPVVLSVIGALVWVSAPDSGVSGASQSFVAYFLALLAVPTVLLTGLPLFGGSGRVLLAVASAVALWLVLGWWATRRARRSPEPSWRAYLVELAPMVLGVWAGLVIGLGAMVLILSH